MYIIKCQAGQIDEFNVAETMRHWKTIRKINWAKSKIHIITRKLNKKELQFLAENGEDPIILFGSKLKIKTKTNFWSLIQYMTHWGAPGLILIILVDFTIKLSKTKI